MSDEFIKWIGVIGSIASLIGIAFAYWQIYKTRQAAEAAKDAADRTQKFISRNLLLSDVSTCTRNLEEIKLFVRIERYESAQIRIGDLILQLIQVREMLESSNYAHQIEFEETISQLSIIREDFEKKLAKSSAKINAVRVNSQLSKISDDLNKLLGRTKTAIEKGE